MKQGGFTIPYMQYPDSGFTKKSSKYRALREKPIFGFRRVK